MRYGTAFHASGNLHVSVGAFLRRFRVEPGEVFLDAVRVAEVLFDGLGDAIDQQIDVGVASL